MRKNFIAKIIVSVITMVFLLVSCKNRDDAKTHHANESAITQYTCPMHTHVITDKPGKCPICQMDLVPKTSNKEVFVDSELTALLKPVNVQVVSKIPAISAVSGTRIYSMEVQGTVNYDTRNQAGIASRIGGRIEKLMVKYNYQPIKKGQLIMEVYSPDLAAAQRELIYLSKSNDDYGMLSRAKQRLQLLGMQPGQIEQVLRTGNIMYRFPVYSNTTGYILEKPIDIVGSAPLSIAPNPGSPASNSGPAGDGMNGMSGSTASTANTAAAGPLSTPVLLREGQYINAGQSLFTIYQTGNLVAEFSLQPGLASKIKNGQRLLFHPSQNKHDMITGRISVIEPVFRNGANFTLARVYSDNRILQPGQLLTAYVPVVYNSGWWLPRSAVWSLGNKTIVFKKETNGFVPMEVVTGASGKDLVQVTSDISDWQVASNANYLVDSESFIKTKKELQ
jgi:Cu(I)/Ag(I) efflux system membrane fusion protein